MQGRDGLRRRWAHLGGARVGKDASAATRGVLRVWSAKRKERRTSRQGTAQGPETATPLSAVCVVRITTGRGDALCGVRVYNDVGAVMRCGECRISGRDLAGVGAIAGASATIAARTASLFRCSSAGHCNGSIANEGKEKAIVLDAAAQGAAVGLTVGVADKKEGAVRRRRTDGGRMVDGWVIRAH